MKQMPLLYLVLLSLFLFACSTPKETTKRDIKNYDVVKKFVNEVNLKIEKNISWVNLMPGSEPKFHISGKLSLLISDDYENETTQLKFIKVYQSGEELYYIMPKVIEELEGPIKKLTFSTIKGLNISKTLDTKNPVVFEFLFYDGKDELKYRVNNVIVEEVH
jgi:hypothetical protein